MKRVNEMEKRGKLKETYRAQIKNERCMRQVPSGNTNNLVKSSVNFWARHFLIYVYVWVKRVCVCENEWVKGKYDMLNSIDNYDEKTNDRKLNSLATIEEEKSDWKRNEMVTCFRGSTTAPYTHGLYAKQFVAVCVSLSLSLRLRACKWMCKTFWNALMWMLECVNMYFTAYTYIWLLC